MPDTLTKLTYQTFQQGKNYFGLAHKILSSQLLQLISPAAETVTKPLSPELLIKIQQRLNQLLEADWQDADRGVYPHSLLFDNPWEDFFRYYPMVWLDLPQIQDRANQKRYQDFSPGVSTDGYPAALCLKHPSLVRISHQPICVKQINCCLKILENYHNSYKLMLSRYLI